MQPAFVEGFLSLCHDNGIAAAIDTCGFADWNVYERLLPHVSLVLFDLKIADRERHREATGVYSDRIFENAAAIAKQGIPMWVRTPVIPGHTDDEENVTALGAFIAERMPVVERWDLLAYTNLGRPKYHRLDLPYALENALLLSREHMERLAQVASKQGVPNVVWSGATRD
jgi:pyruvate formate lyase activating enzyme